MKCRFFTIWIAFSFFAPAFGQFATDFSEGNLDVWTGDKDNFIINTAEELQLNAPSGSTNSWLYTPVTYGDSMVWEFYFKLEFAPSTSNQLRIFLGVHSTDLATTSGYFIEVGASGDQDPIELKYRDGGTDQSLAVSAPGIAGTEPVAFRLRVTKNSQGSWLCHSLNGAVPELLFSATHDLLPLESLTHFGIQCRYTDTRRDKFFFDDISIQPLVADTAAPVFTGLTVLDQQRVDLAFDEPLNEISALDPLHYTLQPGNAHPDQIVYNQNNVILQFASPFESQVEHTLTIEGVKDLAGNSIATTATNFTYVQIDIAAANELLITEIMADPTPSVGLPEAEYLELHNPTSKTFRLSDYNLLTGTSERALPDALIQGGEFVILCDPDDATLFQSFGRVIGVNNFSSLTNTGATLSLRTTSDLVVHEVTYSSSWYGDADKADGGWSLEMINPLAICEAATNWRAANNLLGGTPGGVNSIWSVTADSQGPHLLSLNATGTNTITLRFDETLDALLMENPDAYTISPNVNVAAAIVVDKTNLELTLATDLQPGIIYSFLPFTSFDCLANWTSHTDTIQFGLTVAPEAGDVLINEILFNPVSNGSRFVEIKNVSDKFISLESIAIGRIKGAQQDIYPTGIDENMAPGQLVVFSPDPLDIDARYTVPNPGALYMSTLPSWDDETDNVTLLYNGEVLDSFTYSSSWHSPTLSDQNGVSLERISTLSGSGIASNWASAASTTGYATPTGENSQKLVVPEEGEVPFTVTNSNFSPNGDGYKDFLALNFLLPDGDQVGTVDVYDLEGRQIIRLVANETLGTSSIVQWDGRNSDQMLAEMGIYVIFVQLWDAQGNVNEYRETCALVKR
jgi:hypothetical protein